MAEFVDIIRRELNGLFAFGAEVGVSCGKSSALLLRSFPSLVLCMIDAWATYPAQHVYHRSGDGHARLTPEQQEEHYRQAMAATEFAANRRIVLRMTSMEGSWKIAEHELDFCIIDADHTYAGVMADLHHYRDKVRPGGLLMGHDFDHPRNRRGLFGVDKAVKQFAVKYGRVLRSEGDIWWYDP